MSTLFLNLAIVLGFLVLFFCSFFSLIIACTATIGICAYFCKE